MEYSEEWMMDFKHESNSFCVDFLSGSAAGVAVTLTGHPFDTIKVRMQSESTRGDNLLPKNKLNICTETRSAVRTNSLISQLRYCYFNEGVKGFYKGMTFPLCSVPLVNAVVFAVHEMSKKVLSLHDESQMNMKEGVICGAIAGLVNCIVVTPVELVKCRLQIQHESRAAAYYKGVVDCIRKTYNLQGVRGLYTGNVATIYREVPAYAAQFGGYYAAKKFLANLKKVNVSDLSNLDVMLCGAIGGYSCWQFSYPQDVVKTLIQTKVNDNDATQPINSHKLRTYDGNFCYYAKVIYTQNGFAGFWKGFSACTIRALLANSVLFLSYENSKSFLTKLTRERNEE